MAPGRGIYKQYETHIKSSELLTRGLVFQEWLLIAKSINERSEVFRVWDGQNVTRPAYDPASPKKAFRLKGSSLNGQWYTIVERYSALSFTEPTKDRIIALAGIAQEFRTSSELFAEDILTGLLWEQKSFAGTKFRLPEFPTWSWASIICPVIWDLSPLAKNSWGVSKRAPSTRLTKTTASLVAVSITEGETFSSHSLQQTSNLASPIKDFSVDNRFARLHIHGKMLKLLVWEKFTRDEDIMTACKMTVHRVESAKNLWRKVCLYLQMTEICGWASFEDPDYEQQQTSVGESDVYALVNSVLSGAPGGHGLGYFTGRHDVLNMLFIRNAEGQRYKRVGIRRLFGKEIHKEYRAATGQDIELV
ncbi:hypothetical protein G7Y89_g4523 [Cudoniella acicularis]|uniref:Uncharacterized protein n=1 Tax=Cudoniella acicularis TaxID=354080 RepID=A0A8H4W4W4_9HELO|nr:hypothetical protein G7Y89_g4523 [Cudoniella acicularis]